jgi:hypothetical protein
LRGHQHHSNEIQDAIPFDQDEQHRHTIASTRSVLARTRRAIACLRIPLTFLWQNVRSIFPGSFDLAVTRFSGRPARRPGGVPPADAVTREVYS